MDAVVLFMSVGIFSIVVIVICIVRERRGGASEEA